MIYNKLVNLSLTQIDSFHEYFDQLETIGLVSQNKGPIEIDYPGVDRKLVYMKQYIGRNIPEEIFYYILVAIAGREDLLDIYILISIVSPAT